MHLKYINIFKTIIDCLKCSLFNILRPKNN